MTPPRARGGMAATVAFALAAAAGCGHTHTASDRPSSHAEAEKSARNGKTKTAASTRDRGDEKRGSRRVPLATAPDGLLEPGAAKRIRDQLVSRGFLDRAGDRDGGLDEETTRALRRFQSAEGLPETGMPDRETVRRLGLDPDAIFERAAAGDRDAGGDRARGDRDANDRGSRAGS